MKRVDLLIRKVQTLYRPIHNKGFHSTVLYDLLSAYIAKLTLSPSEIHVPAEHVPKYMCRQNQNGMHLKVGHNIDLEQSDLNSFLLSVFVSFTRMYPARI